MSCSIKYNCCQQPNLCPKNKVCKPFNSPTKPWKRFTCECRDGYYGENCDQPIRSCAGYFNVPREAGKYKVVDSQNSTYEVYCHFDSDDAWTLVQSFSYGNITQENHDFPQLIHPLWKDSPVMISENTVEWNAYRLGKSRMESIKNNSTFLQFTCNCEKHRGIENSDFVQIFLQDITDSEEKNVDVFKLNTSDTCSEGPRATVGDVRGRIGDWEFSECQFQLSQNDHRSLHLHLSPTSSRLCHFKKGAYFGICHCNSTQAVHSCTQKQNSTTQLWFGVRNP